jgi:hypothetical protein
MRTVENHSIDWSAIRFSYERNPGSIRSLARHHHLTEGAIRKRAKADSWVRAPMPECAPRTTAQRAKEKREREKRGERVERVVLKEGQAVLVVDVGEMADCLGVPDWSAEDAAVVLPLVEEKLKRLVRSA